MDIDKEITIEKKLAAVRDYYHDINEIRHKVKPGIIASVGIDTYRLQIRQEGGCFEWWIMLQSGPVEPEIVEVFYSILGLAERDAVAESDKIWNAECESLKLRLQNMHRELEAERAKVSELKDLLKSSKFAHEEQIQECATMVSSERNRAAALVEALEAIKTVNHRTHQSEVETIKIIATKAIIAAHKKGATT
jgi:hypothetical protein